MDDKIDLLKIKIDKAKRALADSTLTAINSVPWQIIILEMKQTRGYSVEQLEDLETETELLLCELINMEDYPKQLEKRMNISEAQANDLVNEMNNLVFSKIKDELIKILEQKKTSIEKQAIEKPKGQYLKEISKSVYGLNKPNLTIPELKAGESKIIPVSTQKDNVSQETSTSPIVHPVLAQKMSGSFQIPSVKTEHTLDNITKTDTLVSDNIKPKIRNSDPYREIPE